MFFYRNLLFQSKPWHTESIVVDDLKESRLIVDPPNDLEQLVDLYNNTLRDLIDKHAPLKTKKMPVRSLVPWYNKDIQAAKRHRRCCERLWNRTELTVHYEMFKAARLFVRELLATAKSQYYNNKIIDCNGNQKTVFSVVNKVLHRKTTVFPDIFDSDKEMAEEFNTFFHQKIQKIRDGFPPTNLAHAIPSDPCHSSLSTFDALSQSDIKKLLNKSSNAFCDLDPMPTWLVKECQDILILPITKIINDSMSMGFFPDSMKIAHVKPLIKKYNLDCNALKNFRPVSNLSLLSKLTERAVATQLKKYLSEHCLNESLQSAYKSCHSTETALLRVKNDIMTSIDNKKAVVLVLLDLSAAFDTVDHAVLFCRLKNMFGLSGKVLEWFQSYLKLRTQSVSIHDSMSDDCHLQFGVPQGSVLGPLVFVLYTKPIGIIAKKYGVQYHLYADDTQLYVSLDLGNNDEFSSSLQNLKHCIEEIRLWMTQNMLKLNDDKTDIIYMASPHCAKSLLTPGLDIGESCINPSSTVRNLGVLFDKYLTMSDQVTSVCKAAYYHLKNIRSLKPFLDTGALITVVHAFVTSRIDYCNSLLYGISNYNINRLQKIQNCAARIVTNTGKYDHITPFLKKLHWLPVRFRISYKILLITYKIIFGEAPEYLSELISVKKSSRTLRSSNQTMLHVPSSRLKTVGDCAFSVASPTLWNILPVQIKNALSLGKFKSALKTYHFQTAYEPYNYFFFHTCTCV